MATTNGPSQHQYARYPVEPPNGGYAIWSTDSGASAMVREDDPAQPTRPDRWRKLEGTSRWYTWDELVRTGAVQRLYTAGELGAAQVPHYHHLPADPNPRLPAGDSRLLTAIGDGRVVMSDDTRRDAPGVQPDALDAALRNTLAATVPAWAEARLTNWATGLTREPGPSPSPPAIGTRQTNQRNRPQRSRPAPAPASPAPTPPPPTPGQPPPAPTCR